MSREKGREKRCGPRAQPGPRLRAEGASMVWSESCQVSLVQALELEYEGTGRSTARGLARPGTQGRAGAWVAMGRSLGWT